MNGSERMHLKHLVKNIFVKASYLIALVIFLFINAGRAQVSEFKYKQITTDDGLVDDMLLRVRQDARGYMWFGTRSGLVRYDGNQLRIYDFDPNQPNGLGGNDINGLHADKDGNLWIGTINGLCRFDFALDQPVSIPIKIGRITYTPRILDITSDQTGTLWIATQSAGLFSYNPKTNHFEHYNHDPSDPTSLASSNVRTVLCTSENEIWAGTISGLCRLDQTTGTFIHFSVASHSTVALSDSVVIALAEGDNGDIWIGTLDGGLNRLNPGNKSLMVYKHNPNDPNGLRDNLVTSVLYDDNTVWVGCGRGAGALQRLNVKTGKVTNLRISEQKIGPRILGVIRDMIKDRTGIIWAGQTYGGVNYFDPNWENYEHYKLNPRDPKDLINAVYGTTPVSNTQLWLSSFYGFILFDRNKGILKKYNDHGNGLFLRNNSIMVGNQIWAPSDRGIYRLDLETGGISNLSEGPNGLSGSYVNRLVPDKQGYVWVASRSGGLDRIDPKTGQIKQFNHIEGDPASLPENNVFAVFTNNDESLWIGTNGGLALFDKKSESFKTYRYSPFDSTSISSDQVSDICRSRDGVLWVATYGGGFNRFNPETGSFKRYTSQNRNIPNNTLYSCIEDDVGNIWISTAVGIARFLPKSEVCDIMIPQPDYYKVSKLPSGELSYSGPRGIIIVNPENIRFNAHPPGISLESVMINGQISRLALSENSLELDHDQNDIEFKFFASHFSNPGQNKYAVFLKGYDDAWRSMGKVHFINYTNLEPGHYTLSAKAASAYDVWSETINFKLHIRYPWWETWWAYGFYFLFSIGLLYSVRKFELNRRKEKENKGLLEAENERKTQELEEARQLQLSMLPIDIPQLAHLDIAVRMQTATEVGGDYYDFSIKKDGSLNVAIGDATGHGMKAGTMVSSMKSIFTTNSVDMAIDEFFNKANHGIKSMNLLRVMMGFTMLHIKENSISMINAGMPPVFIYHSGTKTVEELQWHQPPLGALGNSNFSSKRINVHSGDTILLMSDGLPELQDENGILYGYERVRNLFEEVAEKQPEEIITKLKNDGSAWINDNDPDDDVTFVVIKVK